MLQINETAVAGTVVRILVYRKNKLLLVQSSRTALKGEWELPGGKSENGETPEKTAKRELREETSLKLNSFSKEAELIRPITNGSPYLYVIFKAIGYTGSPRITIPKEIYQASFFHTNSLPPLDERTRFILENIGFPL